MLYSWAYFETRQSTVVYPRPADPDVPLDQLFKTRFINQFTQDDSGDFHGHRKYQPGDSPGKLDWKALARGRGTLVKEFSREDDDDLWLDFDDVLATDTETRLSVLCRAVLELTRGGFRFGLRLPGVEVPPQLEARGFSAEFLFLRRCSVPGFSCFDSEATNRLTCLRIRHR